MLQDAMDADDERLMSAEELAEYMAYLEESTLPEEKAASADVGCKATGDATSLPPSGSGSQVLVSARTRASQPPVVVRWWYMRASVHTR
jgi:hypothetical protein